MRSMQRFILVSLISLTSLASIVLLSWTNSAIHHEVEEVYDASLVQFARQFGGLLNADTDLSNLDHLQRVLQRSTATAWEHEEHEYESSYQEEPNDPGHHYGHKLRFQIWHQDGRLLFSSPARFNLRQPTRAGFENVTEANNIAWRTYSLYKPDKQIWVRTAQLSALRADITNEVAEHILLPLVAILTLLIVAIALTIKIGLRPLKDISHELDQRDSNDLSSIDLSTLPTELHRPIDSLNRMFERVNQTMQRERRFTNDAAHELRTPLAALRIHLDRLSPTQVEKQPLMQGVSRMERVVSQLLVLARLEPKNSHQLAYSTFDIEDPACLVIAELYPSALARNVQIAWHNHCKRPLQAEPTLIEILLRNLLENAIRYTLSGDTVDVFAQDDNRQVILKIIDHGPGIENDLKPEVVQRFYRTNKADSDSAGLGFSIIGQIVQLHQGHYTLQDTPGGGLTIEVKLPNP
ncbi:MAG: ATP-binding protein [Pontibacterium sp.]